LQISRNRLKRNEKERDAALSRIEVRPRAPDARTPLSVFERERDRFAVVGEHERVIGCSAQNQMRTPLRPSSHPWRAPAVPPVVDGDVVAASVMEAKSTKAVRADSRASKPFVSGWRRYLRLSLNGERPNLRAEGRMGCAFGRRAECGASVAPAIETRSRSHRQKNGARRPRESTEPSRGLRLFRIGPWFSRRAAPL